ncbi:MAG: hypothetical protein OEX19_15830 [Gammaproteobacteria bacterium]|nr:hypothetical protein [Gammaproteobacteria bacterium]
MKISTPVIFILSFTLSVFSLSTFASGNKHHKSNMPFEVISQGGQSGIDHQMSMVVDSMMHWEHLWMMHTNMQVNPEPLPKIDFETDIVIAQFLGPVASCGYGINTEKVKNKGDYIKVKTVVSLPAGPIACLIAEQPYEFIKISRTNKLVNFDWEMERN